MDMTIQDAMGGWICNEDGIKKECTTEHSHTQNCWKRTTEKSKDNNGLNTGR
jgi:hypothetical protein